MAETRPLVVRIETYVSSSSSAAQQKASVDEIALLVKKGSLTVESLVRELELYLTTTDGVIRGRGVTLLAEVLTLLSAEKLNQATLNSLEEFFSAKLADWQVVHGALLGCLALLRRRKNVGTSTQGNYAIGIGQSYLQNLQVQLLAQHDRLLCFELLQCLLDCYPVDVASLGEDFIYGVCAAIDNEKDPHCLLLTFRIVESLGKLFPNSSGPVASFVEELFDILSRYFPIYFTHDPHDQEVKRDDLANALMLAFCSTSLFEPFAIPFLLEKLTSSLSSAKVDSLRYLSYCFLSYEPKILVKHLKSIWHSLKEAIFSYTGQESFSLIAECNRDRELQENLVFKEAMNCLETALSKMAGFNHSFIGCILDDGDFDMSFLSIAGEVSYSYLSVENKQKLLAIRNVLHVLAKSSHEYCDMVFLRYFPRLMEILGVSYWKSVSGCMDKENIVLRELSFGALYLSTALLCSCLDMVCQSNISLRESRSNRDTWQCMLQDYHKPLAYFFIAVIMAYETIIGRENDSLEVVCYAVKGLSTLATFPRQYVHLSESVYEDIVIIFVSKLLEKYGDSSFWKFILKALVNLGQSLDKFPDSQKETTYESCVVERIMSELRDDDVDILFSLKLEATFAVGTSRPKVMPGVVKKLDKLLFLMLIELIKDGSSRSRANLTCLLEHYSSQLLPWCFVAGYCEEAVLHFALELWNRLDGLPISHFFFQMGQETVDALMMALKTSVGVCNEWDQFRILDMAYRVVQSNVFSSLDYSDSFCAMKLYPDHLYSVSCEFTRGQKVMFSLFISVIVALRPQTVLPNVNIILKWLLIFFQKGHDTAAQGLGSIINKWSKESDRSICCLLEEVLDHVLCEGPIEENDKLPGCTGKYNRERNALGVGIHHTNIANWVSGIAWIGKGLLLCGNARVKDVVMLFLKYLVPNDSKEIELLEKEKVLNFDILQDCRLSAADAFETLLCDSDAALNKNFHAIVKPLYKQKFFLTVTPLLLSCILDANINTRTILYRAFGHVVCNTPQAALIPEAKRLILPILEGLQLLSVNIINKDLVHNLLLVFSGFLLDDIAKEAVIENGSKIISCILGLTSYPHMMLVRETAIQSLIALAHFPYTRIYPMRQQVLQAMSKALDDPKRHVRVEAIKCLHTWMSLS